MPTESESYQNPLVKRYASAGMLRIFSDDNRYRTWRRLWLALAESEAELGLGIEDLPSAAREANDDPRRALPRRRRPKTARGAGGAGGRCARRPGRAACRGRGAA